MQFLTALVTSFLFQSIMFFLIDLNIKSYVKQWYIENKYGKRKDWSNKYTDKGTMVEVESIELLAKTLGRKMEKNEKFYENEYMTGTPDVVLRKEIVDMKNSWDLFTFPLFCKTAPNTNYLWQLEGYMELADKPVASLVYALMNTPEDLRYTELRKISFDAGENGQLSETMERESEEYHDYTDLPIHKRFKVFSIARNRHKARQIEKRVIECRKYILELEALDMDIAIKLGTSR